jgi:hypothetical protein
VSIQGTRNQLARSVAAVATVLGRKPARTPRSGRAVAAVPGRVGLPAQARGHAASLAPIITRLDPDGSLSLRALAAKLTAEGLPTPAGAAIWTAMTVARVKAKLAA